MSEESASAALRSAAHLVVIEAPAGCGKTFQGSLFARDRSGAIGDGRVLILAHTHAACDVFAARTGGHDGRVEIRTIDSLIDQIAAAYHLVLDLPADTGAWARSRKNGYGELAAKAARLLRASPIVARSLARRYPVIVSDEHQDASADQHAILVACLDAGCVLRVFGDPMQRIYGSKKKAEVEADGQRWDELKRRADALDTLDQPRRWSGETRPLGDWILSARTALEGGGKVDLAGPLPPGVAVLVAENLSPVQHKGYRLAAQHSRPIYALVESKSSVLVLASQNETVNALRALFNRKLIIWEGHVRDRLSALVSAVRQHDGDAGAIAQAALTFLESVASGCSPSAYGNTLLREVRSGCKAKRTKKPAILQTLARILLDQPNHKGIAEMLKRLHELTRADDAFKSIKFDYPREFWEAVQLGDFDDPETGFAEISHRRSHARPRVPARAISTIHKAKGLECSDVLIMPCDARHFADTPAARCRLYVAMSRAMRSLTFVVSRQSPSPLIKLP